MTTPTESQNSAAFQSAANMKNKVKELNDKLRNGEIVEEDYDRELKRYYEDEEVMKQNLLHTERMNTRNIQIVESIARDIFGETRLRANPPDPQVKAYWQQVRGYIEDAKAIPEMRQEWMDQDPSKFTKRFRDDVAVVYKNAEKADPQKLTGDNKEKALEAQKGQNREAQNYPQGVNENVDTSSGTINNIALEGLGLSDKDVEAFYKVMPGPEYKPEASLEDYYNASKVITKIEEKEGIPPDQRLLAQPEI